MPISPVLSAQTFTERLDPLLRGAGYFPQSSVTVAGDAERLLRQLTQDVPTLWVGAPWGSLSFVGVCQADQLTETQAAQLMDRVFQVALALVPWTGELVFHAGLGPAVQLGVFGRVLFVWESTPHLAIPQLQRLKRINWLKKCQVVPWSAVLPERRVYGHRGLPFTMGAPSVSQIQQLLTA